MRALRSTSLAAHLVLLPTALLVLVPFVWMLASSIKAPAEILEASLWPVPRPWFGFAHYADVLRSVPIGRFMVNGVLVCAGILVVQIVVAVPAAYALAKLPFAGRRWLFLGLLGALAIPIQVTALPLFIALSQARALNTYLAQVLPFVLSALAIVLLTQVFKRFPDEVIHAARLDGMNELEIVWRVVVPSARSAIVAFSVLSLVTHWNDLYWPLVVVYNGATVPPALGMMLFASTESGTNHGVLMAGATLITAPVVLACIMARRHFIQDTLISVLPSDNPHKG